MSLNLLQQQKMLRNIFKISLLPNIFNNIEKTHPVHLTDAHSDK